MGQTVASPRWAAAVPVLQFGVVVVYGLPLFVDESVPGDVFLGFVLGSPLIFGTAWALGWWVERRRGATRPDGSEYMIATLGNVLMGSGLLFSVVFWVYIAMALHSLPD